MKHVTEELRADATNEQAIMARAMLRVAMDKATARVGVNPWPSITAAIADLPNLEKIKTLPHEARPMLLDALVDVGVRIPLHMWATLKVEEHYREPPAGDPVALFVAKYIPDMGQSNE